MISSGMKIAVVGCGVTGRAAVKYGLKQGAEVYISDSRNPDIFVAEEAALISDPQVKWEAGGHTDEFLSQAELILVSPGVPLHLPVLEKMRAEGIPVVGELAVAAGNIGVPVVAVTGTNGKTTVTSLIGEIFRHSGKEVFVGGNIGTPLYDYLSEPAGFDVVVVEVSSFQLASSGSFAPDVGILLNITPDHIDWHGSVEAYKDAKLSLFRNQGEKNFAIINGDDPMCCQIADQIPGNLQRYCCSKESKGCAGVISPDGMKVSIAGVDSAFELDGTSFAGFLGAGNCAAAMLACLDLGCDAATIADVIKSFAGLPHRMQRVGTVAGVEYIDDSKATNTGAVLGALRQLEQQVILIAGGRDKGDDYTLLSDAVQEKVRSLVLIGEAAELIEQALRGNVPVVRAASMADAVSAAAGMAEKGDVVLLSPACASFDMFRSYGHRGDVFQEEVRALRKVVSEEQAA